MDNGISLRKEQLLQRILEAMLPHRPDFPVEKWQEAYHFACSIYGGMVRYSGEEYVTHPLHVALILAGIGADEEVVMAGLFCDALDKTSTTAQTLEEKLPKPVVRILVQAQAFKPDNLKPSETIVLLKLAERLHNMQTLNHMEEQVRAVKARETLSVFLPLATQIGNKMFAKELELLSMAYA